MKTKQLYDEFLITSMVAGFEPVEIMSASGTTIVGADGTSYLDCFSGISVVNAGHGHPRVLAAAARQNPASACARGAYHRPPAGCAGV